MAQKTRITMTDVHMHSPQRGISAPTEKYMCTHTRTHAHRFRKQMKSRTITRLSIVAHMDV